MAVAAEKLRAGNDRRRVVSSGKPRKNTNVHLWTTMHIDRSRFLMLTAAIAACSRVELVKDDSSDKPEKVQGVGSPLDEGAAPRSTANASKAPPAGNPSPASDCRSL